MIRISALAGILLLALAALSAGGQTTSAATPIAVAPALKISAGDLLDIAVFDTPELSSKVRVDHLGNINLPVGVELHVGDLTVEQADAAI